MYERQLGDQFSIPYGTIKTASPVAKSDFGPRFSIPYGTIKTLVQITHNPLIAYFQFLMVRLRPFVRWLINSRSYFSIPYGTIKT